VQRRVPIGRINPVLPPAPAAEPPSNLPEQLVQGFDLAAAEQATPTPAAADPAALPTPPTSAASASGPDLAELIETLEIPAAEKQRQVVAVDLARITPARPAPPPAPKPKLATTEAKAKPKAAPEPAPAKPASSGKYWVQVATGSDLSALRFDYRRLARQQAELFKSVAGYTSPWGKTRRLVVGPFASLSEAKAFETKFRAGGGDGFAWVSDGDTPIEALPAK
jgi:cell division septation protein DedD